MIQELQSVVDRIVEKYGQAGALQVAEIIGERSRMAARVTSEETAIAKGLQAYWASKFNDRRPLTERDQRAVANFLRMGFTPAELRLAIDGVVAEHDQWHVRRGFHVLGSLLQRPDKVRTLITAARLGIEG